MMERDERGWEAPDRHVCKDCVEDDYLQSLIETAATENECDYCGNSSEEVIAAPLEVILPSIAGALFSRFAEPGAAGLPRDSGEWVGEEHITDTSDALESIPFNCHEELFEDVEAAFQNTAWYPCANGYWLDLPKNKEMGYAWQSFVREVKHHVRFFFNEPNPERDKLYGGARFSPPNILSDIGFLVSSLGLCRTLPAGTTLFRARRSAKPIKTFEALGPPPSDLARAGRMNPAGISYLYLAFDGDTVVSEVLGADGTECSLGEFKIREDLTVLDLSALPAIPSVFETERKDEREGLLFLSNFAEQISTPVTKDGREHIDYVPSQIVSEYFAYVFRTDDGERINGMIYSSAVHESGVNIVVFPSPDYSFQWTDYVEMGKIKQVKR